MPHNLLWRHNVLLTVGVYLGNHGVLYTIGIGMTRRFQKSLGPFVCNSNKYAYPSFTINCRIIIRISDKRAWHPLEENEEVFSRILHRIFEKVSFAYYRVIDSGMIFYISGKRDWCTLQEN